MWVYTDCQFRRRLGDRGIVSTINDPEEVRESDCKWSVDIVCIIDENLIISLCQPQT